MKKKMPKKRAPSFSVWGKEWKEQVLQLFFITIFLEHNHITLENFPYKILEKNRKIRYDKEKHKKRGAYEK